MKNSYLKNKSLGDLLSGLDGAVVTQKPVTKTVSVRLPVLDLARIDVIAELKDVSRNVMLNDVIEVSIAEMLTKLAQKNEQLVQQIEAKAAELAKKLSKEGEHPPHKGPKHKRHPK